MTFVQNFWNRWNTNHLAFVRELRKNIVDMFVDDEAKKCSPGPDRGCMRSRSPSPCSDCETGRLSRCRSNRSVSSCRSDAKKRSYGNLVDCGGNVLTMGIKQSQKGHFVRVGGNIPYCSGVGSWNCPKKCEFGILVFLTLLLLIAAVAITIYWIMTYQGTFGFPWDEAASAEDLLNTHPMGTVCGFIFLTGFSILFFRMCRCLERLCLKILHLFFNLLALGFVAIGGWAIYEYHKKSEIPHFYSLHSWIGCIAVALFLLQFLFGIFCFLILLCCEGCTACCRASCVPIHSAFGLCTFLLAICACLTALSERTVTLYGSSYKTDIAEMTTEMLLLNILALVLVAIAILILYICLRESFRYRPNTIPECCL